MQLNFCVDFQYFPSCIVLGFMDIAKSFYDTADEQLRLWLDSSAENLKKTLTLECLDELVEKNLKMNFDNKSAKSRMQG